MTKIRLAWPPAAVLLLALTGCQTNQPSGSPPVTSASQAPVPTPTTPPPMASQVKSRALTTTEEAQAKAYDDATRMATMPGIKITNQMRKAGLYFGAQQFGEALAIYNRILTEWGDTSTSSARNDLALVWLNKGQLHKAFGQRREEIAAYQELARLYGNDVEPAQRRAVATGQLYTGEAQVALGERLQGEQTYRQAMERYCPAPIATVPLAVACAKLGIRLGQSLGERKLTDDALAAYDAVIGSHGSNSNNDVRQEVTEAHWRKAVLLAENQRRQEAVASFARTAEVGALSGTRQAIAYAAQALGNQASMLDSMGQQAQALALYDRLIGQFDSRTEDAVIFAVARAQVNKALILFRQKRPAEVLPLCDAALRKTGERPALQMREVSARAGLLRGQALVQLQRYDVAITAFDAVGARFGNAKENSLRDLAANAMSAKANAIGLRQSRGKVEESIGELDKQIAAAEARPEPERSRGIATVLLTKGVVYTVIGMHDEAIAAYQDIATRYGDTRDAKLRETVANAGYLHAISYHDKGQSAEAARLLRDFVQRYKPEQSPAIQQLVNRAEDWLDKNRQYDSVG